MTTDEGRLRVFLLDDHELVRRGVREMLEGEGDIDVVGEASTAAEALARVPAVRPQVAVCTWVSAPPERSSTTRSPDAPGSATKTVSARASSAARAATSGSTSSGSRPDSSEVEISALAVTHCSRRRACSYSRAFSMATPAAAARASTTDSSSASKEPPPRFSVR